MRLTTNFLTIKNESILRLGTFHVVVVFLLLSFSSFAQVGINTNSPTTTLDINGALSLRESPRPLELRSGSNENIGLGGETPFSQYRIEGPTTAFFIDGIKTVDEPDGQIVRLINTTNQIMTIVHNDSGDEIKIVCPSDKDLTVGGKNSSVTLQYSKGLRKWTVFGYASTSNGSVTYNASGTTDISRTNSSWGDLDGSAITFTPSKSVVYVSYNVQGVSNCNVWVHLLKGAVEIPKSQLRWSKTGTGETYYHVSLAMLPVEVTPGVEITIKAEWYREGSGNQYIRNDAGTKPYHGRNLIIID